MAEEWGVWCTPASAVTTAPHWLSDGHDDGRPIVFDERGARDFAARAMAFTARVFVYEARPLLAARG